MVELAGRIEAAGVGVPSVSVGSTATAEIMATIPGITEIRPGGYAFYDYGQVLLGTVEPEACAATVVATVVSGERPGRAIIDAGSNIFGAAPVSAVVSTENNDYGLLPSLPGWRVHSLSEEHGWLRWEGPGPTPMLDVGLRVEVIPVHICLAFNGAGRSVAVREGQVVARWEASARGHAW